MTIKILKQQGKALKQIARETKLSRNTVKKYLHCEGEPKYQQRVRQRSKLDPFKEYIQSRIQAAKPDWIPAAVIYSEILELGYTGKIRILSTYMASLKPQQSPEQLVRFETDPGRQLQADFTIIRRGTQPLKAFVATLGFSRASYVRFYDNERTESWLDGLERSFEFFGGVAHEVLFDNAKAIMIERDAYEPGCHRWNHRLLSVAQDYGFIPRVCKPYRARTKGKVERFNGYLKSSFIIPLQATLRSSGLILDVQTANAYIGPWLTKSANARVHGTTGKIPNEQLMVEQKSLLPLPMRFGSMHLQRQAMSVPVPVESLQHPLSLYDQVLGGTHEFTA